METTEQMRVKYETQLSQLRETLEKTQQELHTRTMTMEQQISGKIQSLLLIVFYTVA